MFVLPVFDGGWGSGGVMRGVEGDEGLGGLDGFGGYGGLGGLGGALRALRSWRALRDEIATYPHRLSAEKYSKMNKG